MSELTSFGLKNCDTCRKARKWLDTNDIAYRYHDVREDGLSRDEVTAWVETLEWQAVVNRRSTTWRSLPESVRGTMDAGSAVDAVVSNPTLAKRPVLRGKDFLQIGFDTGRYEQLLNRSGR